MVVSGALIVVGLVLLVLGNQVILEGINQGSGQLSSNQALTVLSEFDTENTSTGIFAVQIIEFKEGTFSAKILNPSDIEIMLRGNQQRYYREKNLMLQRMEHTN